jgi:LmbE family N-acetylglucosaminyl deacetylase
VSAPAGPLTGRSLLGIFAHPDDEALACGGLLARCSALGAHVSLLCATHGEWGGAAGGAARRGSVPLRTTASGANDGSGIGPAAGRWDQGGLAETRRRELEAAAEVLGVADIAILDHEDGMLPWVDAGVLESDIRDAIERRRPDVVITFGEDGLYWHPDHIALHTATTAAVAALGAGAPALYYVTMPPGRMRAVLNRVAAQDGGPSPIRILGVADADAFGAMRRYPTPAPRRSWARCTAQIGPKTQSILRSLRTTHRGVESRDSVCLYGYFGRSMCSSTVT